MNISSFDLCCFGEPQNSSLKCLIGFSLFNFIKLSWALESANLAFSFFFFKAELAFSRFSSSTFGLLSHIWCWTLSSCWTYRKKGKEVSVMVCEVFYFAWEYVQLKEKQCEQVSLCCWTICPIINLLWVPEGITVFHSMQW